MRLQRTSLVTNLLLFHGILAAPLAWTAQLVMGYGVGEASCSEAGSRWGIDSRAWEIGITVAAGAIAVSALLVATMLFLADRRGGAIDDRGRVGFMAGGGVLVSSVFIVLILLGGIAAVSISHCRQA